MGMQTSRASAEASRVGLWLTGFGLGILALATVLYVTGSSRAVALLASPVGLVAVLLGVASLRGHALPRWALLVLGSVVAVLLVLGVGTWIYAAARPPVSM
jgi:hypothetical protein